MKIRRLIFLILIIINCITIFYFSNQVADNSSNSSGNIVNWIINTFPITEGMSQAQIEVFISEVLQPIVRKLAHFTLYTMLGFFIMNLSVTYKGSNYQKGLTTWFFGSLYAISDEIHQLFVEGRSCEFRDMCIDSLGIITGILIALFILIILRKIFKKEKIKEKFDRNTKVIFISSTGGHFSELMQLKPLMKKCDYQIITEKTETNKNLKARYRHKIDFLLYDTKKHPFKYVFVLLGNCFISLYLYLKYRPRIIITTGTHTAGPMCCIGKILGSKIIYIETFANRTSKTATGKLLYLFADVFIVQWKEMLKVYPKAKCFGWIY